MTSNPTPLLVIREGNATTATFHGPKLTTAPTATTTTTTDVPDMIQTHAEEEHASSTKIKSDEKQTHDYPPQKNSPQPPYFHSEHNDHIQALEAELIQELREGRKEVNVAESSSSSTAVIQGTNEDGMKEEGKNDGSDANLDGEEEDWKSTVAKHAIVVVAVMASVIFVDLFVINRNHRRGQPSYASLQNDDDDDDERFQDERSWIDASMGHNSHDEEVVAHHSRRQQKVQIINGEALRVV
jgi:hypothetical protein